MIWGKGLPSDIGMSIFSRLNISNLGVCRLVCKTWNSIILDYAYSSKLNNDFVLSVSDEVPNPTVCRACNAKMYCFRFDPTKNLDVDFDISELEGNKSASSLPFDGDWFLFTLLCSCNGLLFICKCNVDTMCHGIFNPTTNEFHHVPEIFYDIYAFGLGFIPSTKQYKLFRSTRSDLIAYHTQQKPIARQEPTTIIDVFHFGRNQWRQLHSLPYIIEDGGIYMNGVIYWSGKKNKYAIYALDVENEYAIYALDVESEKIELSATLRVGPGSVRVRMQRFDGNVYALIYINLPTKTHSSIQVWRMEERNSWIREFDMDDMPKDCGSILLIKAGENGEILCRFGRHSFLLYNPSTRRKKIFTKTKVKHLTGICQIETLNFGSLPNILAGDESRVEGELLVRSKRSKRRRSKRSKRRSKRRPMRHILMKSSSRLLRNILK